MRKKCIPASPYARICPEPYPKLSIPHPSRCKHPASSRRVTPYINPTSDPYDALELPIYPKAARGTWHFAHFEGHLSHLRVRLRLQVFPIPLPLLSLLLYSCYYRAGPPETARLYAVSTIWWMKATFQPLRTLLTL